MFKDHNIAMNVYLACPCTECAERYVGCHSKCGDYIQYKRDLEKAKTEKEAYEEKMCTSRFGRRH